MDLWIVNLIWKCSDGNLEPLAKHIESGGRIDDDLRAFIAKVLRGGLSFKAGNRRTGAQVSADKWTAAMVSDLQASGVGEGPISLYKAKKIYAEAFDMNPETLNTILRRAGASGKKPAKAGKEPT